MFHSIQEVFIKNIVSDRFIIRVLQNLWVSRTWLLIGKELGIFHQIFLNNF